MTKKATSAAGASARATAALIKAQSREEAERRAEAEASRVRDMFEADRASFARRYGAIR